LGRGNLGPGLPAIVRRSQSVGGGCPTGRGVQKTDKAAVIRLVATKTCYTGPGLATVGGRTHMPSIPTMPGYSFVNDIQPKTTQGLVLSFWPTLPSIGGVMDFATVTDGDAVRLG
jgi:hypothetical protein